MAKIAICASCFHYSDWDTIVNLFQYQNDAFQMPGSSHSSNILDAAGRGGHPGGGPPGGGSQGGGAPGGGPPGHGGKGSKDTTPLSRRSLCGLVPAKFCTGGVQQSAAGTSQTNTTNWYILWNIMTKASREI